jgi:hypothetical protein
MNSMDDQLDRLLKAASEAPARIDATVPFGLETRVRTAWRERFTGGTWSPALLFRGLGLAFAILLACLLPLVEKTASVNPASDYLQLADSTVQVGDKL